MKVFITIELGTEDTAIHKLPVELHKRLIHLIVDLRTEGIPVQYKETNLPRLRRGA